MRLLFRDAWAIKAGPGLYKARSDDLAKVLWHGRFFERKKDAVDYLQQHRDWLVGAKVVKIRLIVEEVM